jgi:DNA-binding NarL/FixJ family response regulator
VAQTPGDGGVGMLPRRRAGTAQPPALGLVRPVVMDAVVMDAEVVDAVVVDEAELIHFAVRALLAATSGFGVVAAARSVGAGKQLVRRLRPGLLICDADIAGESGIGLCQWVRQVSPATRVAILTSRDEPLLAQSALAAGAYGYLLKDSAPQDLAGYLEEAAAGLRVLDQRLGRAARPQASRAGPADELRPVAVLQARTWGARPVAAPSGG